jgi:hypothetical protein
MVKQLYREVCGFVRTLAEIRETLDRILADLDGSNKKSAIFWAEFRRDFPEVELDEIAWRNVVYGYNSATVTSDTRDTSAGDNQRLPAIESLAGPPMS